MIVPETGDDFTSSKWSRRIALGFFTDCVLFLLLAVGGWIIFRFFGGTDEEDNFCWVILVLATRTVDLAPFPPVDLVFRMTVLIGGGDTTFKR